MFSLQLQILDLAPGTYSPEPRIAHPPLGWIPLSIAHKSLDTPEAQAQKM
jgi:hypothetical protein